MKTSRRILATKREKYHSDPDYKKRQLEAVRLWRKNNPEKARLLDREKVRKNPEKYNSYSRKYREKVKDLLMVLRAEMPELMKEFGLYDSSR